jgi:hypothetical protein
MRSFFCISTVDVDVAVPHFSRVVDSVAPGRDCFLETQPMAGDEETKTKARDSHQEQEIVFKFFFSFFNFLD